MEEMSKWNSDSRETERGTHTQMERGIWGVRDKERERGRGRTEEEYGGEVIEVTMYAGEEGSVSHARSTGTYVAVV